MQEDNFKFEFGRPQKIGISREGILNELERVAEHYNYNYFRRKDFDKIADIHSATVERCFDGSWSDAMLALRKRLKQKNKDIVLSHRRKYSEKEMFEEMERIWRLVGHRPSRNEWTANRPKISYDTLYRHFGGWTKACLGFIEYKSGRTIIAAKEEIAENRSVQNHATSIRNKIPRTKKKVEKTRTIPLNIRLKVFSRDNFRCVFCGKSPATDVGTKLHIDHIVPFSRGGTNILKNLQTLCEECNIGKSNKQVF
jgi:5-methylcytosine-specific restriction endonuclease McrA